MHKAYMKKEMRVRAIDLADGKTEIMPNVSHQIALAEDAVANLYERSLPGWPAER